MDGVANRTGLAGTGWILGFDIGGTKTAVIAGTAAGEVLERRVRPSEADRGFDHMWSGIAAAGDALVRERGTPLAVGVSIGGPLDQARGVILGPPNLPGWTDIPLGDRLAERYGVAAHVEHDAKAGLLAEWYFGAARGASDAVFLTLGTGLGCGILAGGRLVRGAGDGAGEIGHWRVARSGPIAYGKAGSLEAFASGSGVERLARYRDPVRWPGGAQAADIVAAARDGDPAARSVLRETAHRLGGAIAQLADLLDPEVVVLGALGWRAGDLLLPAVRRTVAREALPRPRRLRIVPAELGERLGDVAALVAAIHHGRLSGAMEG